jgi:pyruvate dehydrogenase E2 component (dihydrolipoamide acetyltransferase)
VLASPLAKKLAAQLGIDISQVPGRGVGGRVEKADVEAYAKAAAGRAGAGPDAGAREGAGPGAGAARNEREAAGGVGAAQSAGRGAAGTPGQTDAGAETASEAAEYTVTPYTGMRRAVGENMRNAWTDIPMVTHHVSADAGELLELRQKLNAGAEAQDARISVNDLLMKLTAAALVQTPAMNATFESDEIRVHAHVNLGMATALTNGLIVPVIRRAEQKGLLEISRVAKSSADRARSGRLTYDDTQGGTFTVTNLGGYGSVDFFTPIINPPQAAILGIGRIKDAAVPVRGELCVRPLISMSLTYDHRIIDGAVAAEFMKILIGFMEAPFRALLG